METGQLIIDTAPRIVQAQPDPAIAQLNDAEVRQAIVNAEANNLDPLTLNMADLAQVQATTPAPVVPVSPMATEVPQKFLKPDGAVDVEKIMASTKQLDEAIQKKEEATQRTVDDYLREYKERETKFRSTPNPERIAASLPPPAQELAPNANMSQQQIEEIIRQDWSRDPMATTARLIEIAVDQRLKPFQERDQLDAVRSNIQGLAERDSRVLRPDVFEAIKTKLASDPDLWKLKNPHKAAWLEVKEEMRLGEPTQAQAQPSRSSPVLGGGTPPSAPSTSGTAPQNVLSNLHSLDLRDKKQEALGDAAVRAALMNSRG